LIDNLLNLEFVGLRALYRLGGEWNSCCLLSGPFVLLLISCNDPLTTLSII
jgi:hypothetical protein